MPVACVCSMMRKEGDITFNGAPPNKNMKRNMGFVLQVKGVQTHPASNRTISKHALDHCMCFIAIKKPKPWTTRRSVTSLSVRWMLSCVQDDLMYESLTVFETLFYAAQLRLPRHMTLAQKKERVNTVITALGLDPCKDTIIGACARPS